MKIKLQFDCKVFHVIQGKGKKDCFVPLGEHWIRGLKKYIDAERSDERLFIGQPLENRKGDDFDSRYSQKGVQRVTLRYSHRLMKYDSASRNETAKAVGKRSTRFS